LLLGASVSKGRLRTVEGRDGFGLRPRVEQRRRLGLDASDDFAARDAIAGVEVDTEDTARDWRGNDEAVADTGPALFVHCDDQGAA
jgi:hypothetical protein